MSRLRRFYEKLPYGHTSTRIAYAKNVSALPEESSKDAEWTEDAAFSASDAILANPSLKQVYHEADLGVAHLKSPRAEHFGPELDNRMAVASSRVNMGQRAVMQHLSLTEWKLANRLPVRAGDRTLSGIVHHGRIEMRGKNHLTEIRLTEAGHMAMRFRV